MMNRGNSFKEYGASIAAGRSMSAALTLQHRRESSLASKDFGDNLDLFSRSRRRVSLPSADESDASLTLGKISVVNSTRNGLDDLLTSTEGGKHDYDWLRTPPETPLNPSAEGSSEFQPNRAARRSHSVSRSSSTAKSSSRLSTTQPESNVSSRPARSSSVSCSSFSHAPTSNISSIRSSSSNILNTSSASVSSYMRSNSPVTRSSSTASPSTPSCQSTPSRYSTPSKVRSASSLSSSSNIKPRSSVSSRPSTPASRPQISANLTPSPTLSRSRPSTPTRRSSISSLSLGANLSMSTGRVTSNGRSQSSASRPSSPSPLIRSHQPVVPPDFPLKTPPNLRTTLLDRPSSASRSRPSASAASKVNTENQGSANSLRRPSSPIVSRGRSVKPNGRGRAGSNGHYNHFHEPRRSLYVSESPGRRRVKGPTTDEANGFGRTISKKSLDMAIRHMDVRGGPGTTRPLTGTVLYPQSIRSTPTSTRAQYSSGSSNSSLSSSDINGRLPCVSGGGSISENAKHANNGSPENSRAREDSSDNITNNGRLFGGRVSKVDVFESSRYDALLLKEDVKNTYWLHGGDDQGLGFDNGFEALPEPFGNRMTMN